MNGRQFDAFKFRTMYVDADRILEERPDLQEELARNHKLKDDPRITRVGRILRRWSLDELPQFLNVLRREMSVIGPRMISPDEMPKYNQWGMNLLTVQPGITGLWQVSGRSNVSYVERVRLDMYYIRNWSIWLDLLLLVRTIPAVLGAALSSAAAPSPAPPPRAIPTQTGVAHEECCVPAAPVSSARMSWISTWRTATRSWW